MIEAIKEKEGQRVNVKRIHMEELAEEKEKKKGRFRRLNGVGSVDRPSECGIDDGVTMRGRSSEKDRSDDRSGWAGLKWDLKGSRRHVCG